MRLIDADKLLYDDIKDIHGNTYMIVHAPDIDMAPTAFDREKVLDQMRHEHADAIIWHLKSKHTAYTSEAVVDAWTKAIEIVERGGIE